MLNRSTNNLLVLPYCAVPVQSECSVALWIWKLVPPVLLALGTCGNILNIIVMSRRRLRAYASTMYLLVLAVADLTMLWSSVTRGFLLRLGTEMKNWSAFNCIVHEWLVYTVGGFSVWLLVLLTIERTLFTVSPVFASERITKKRTIIAIIVVLLVIAVFSGHLLFLFEFNKVVISTPQTTQNETTAINGNSFVCSPRPGDHKEFATGLYRVLIMIFLNIVPGVIIATGNIIIAVKLLVEMKRRILRVHPETQRSNILDEKRTSSAKRLFFLCSFFFLTTGPYTSFGVIKSTYFSNAERDEKLYSRLQLTHAVVIMLLYCNYTFNFLLYFMSGSLFKTELLKMISAVKRKFETIMN